MTAVARPTATGVVAGVFVAAVTAVLFAGCLDVGLLADDHALLGAVGRGAGWAEPLPVGSGVYYRPLVVASLLPGGVVLQHGVSLALHVLAALLVVALAGHVGCRPPAATALAALFAVHPLVVTPVCWLAARGDLLCAVLVLAGILAFVRFLRRDGRGRLAAAGLAVVLAPLAKETGLVLTPVLAVLWLLARHGDLPDDAATERTAAAGRALVLYGLLTAVLTALLALLFWRHAPGSLWTGPAGAAGVLLLAVNAVLLRIDEFDLRRWAYAFPWLRTASAALALLVAATLTTAAARIGGRRAVLRVALLAALPMLPLLPLMALGWARERQMYLPWALLVVAAALVLGSRRRQAPAVWAAVVLGPLLAWSSLAGVRVWRDNAAYLERACAGFRRAVAAAPADLPVVLAGYPARRGEVPLYANDPHETLYRCLHGTFGRLQRLHAYGALVLRDPDARPERALEARAAGDDLLLRVTSPRAYLRLGGRQGPGAELSVPGGRITVDAVDRYGDVAAFRLTPRTPGGALVLVPGPDGFRFAVPPAAAETVESPSSDQPEPPPDPSP